MSRANTSSRQSYRAEGSSLQSRSETLAASTLWLQTRTPQKPLPFSGQNLANGSRTTKRRELDFYPTRHPLPPAAHEQSRRPRSAAAVRLDAADNSGHHGIALSQIGHHGQSACLVMVTITIRPTVPRQAPSGGSQPVAYLLTAVRRSQSALPPCCCSRQRLAQYSLQRAR